IVQADHTPVDLIVVDDVNRLPIGRPWVTIIFDVASRAVLGFHATLEAPSATSVAMALSMARLPKSKWLKALAIDLEWPMHGIPEVLHLDWDPLLSHLFTESQRLFVRYNPRNL